MTWIERIRVEIESRILWLAYWALSKTWTIDEQLWPDELLQKFQTGMPSVWIHRHQDEFCFLRTYGQRQMTVLVSHSKDGRRMARLLELLGFQVARGSSSKGGISGLLSLMKLLKSSNNKLVSFAVDGPRGPYGIAKPGFAHVASHFSAPIVIFVAVADRQWNFVKSWSRAFLPKPWAKVQIRIKYYPYEQWSQWVLNDDNEARGKFELVCKTFEAEIESVKHLAVQGV